MKAITVVAMLLATSAYAQEDATEMQDLEADMARGHQAVMEQRPVETITTAPPAMVPHAMRREGFTFELGLGAGGTSDYVSGNTAVSGVLNASIGGFLSNRTALLLHFAGANNEQYAKVNDINADRYHSITSLFLGPQIQFFPIDRFMLAVGVGGVARVDDVRVDVRHTRDGDTHDWKSVGGVGASVRAAVTVYQRQDAAAIRVGVEALPSYVGHDWHTTVALMGELQAF